MGSVNFIGSTNDGGDDKGSQRYDFDYTDPEKDKPNSGQLKPKTSFFSRRKKSTAQAEPAKKKEQEVKFVEKEQVRKGKYKPTTTKNQSQKTSPVSASASAVYAPTRGSATQSASQSSVQPTFAQVNRTESITPHSSASVQPVIAPAMPTSHPATQPTDNVPLSSSNQASSPTAPLPTAPTPTPSVQPTPSLPQSQVFPATPTTPAVSTVSSAPSPPLAGSSGTASVAPAPAPVQHPVSQKQAPIHPPAHTIPAPPPPPVHAAPLPASVKTNSVSPALQAQQQVGNYKMYDTSTQVRPDAILGQPMQMSSAVPSEVAAAPLQAAQHPNLPQLTPTPQPVSKIPTPPAPPKHTPTSVPTPPPPIVLTQNSPAVQPAPQPTGLPAGATLSKNTTAPLGQPAVPHTVNTRPAQPGVVHAQNVESMHGQKTDPEAITGKFLAVNLLPVDFLKELSPTSKVVGLIKVALICCTLVGVIYGIMVGYQSYFIIQTKNNQLEINRLETEILTYVPLQNEINTTNAQLQSVSTLLARHIYWSNVFSMLEQYTLPNVHYQNFSGNTTGLITLQALTTDFASVSRQIHILNNEAPFVQSAISTTATRNEVTTDTSDDNESTAGEEASATVPGEIVSFTINLHLDPAIFLYESNANNNGNN